MTMLEHEGYDLAVSFAGEHRDYVERTVRSCEKLLTATLFAHESAAFGVHVSAGLGGDLVLPGAVAGGVPPGAVRTR